MQDENRRAQEENRRTQEEFQRMQDENRRKQEEIWANVSQMKDLLLQHLTRQPEGLLH